MGCQDCGKRISGTVCDTCQQDLDGGAEWIQVCGNCCNATSGGECELPEQNALTRAFDDMDNQRLLAPPLPLVD